MFDSNSRSNPFLGIILFLAFAGMFSCQSATQTTQLDEPYKRFTGQTMGTTWSVLVDTQAVVQKSAFEKILIDLNGAVSTYDSTSTISKFNSSENNRVELGELPNDHFLRNFKIAKRIYQLSAGSFDPTVMSLVNYWGFGYTDKNGNETDSLKVKELVSRVGFDRVQIVSGDGLTIEKENPKTQLDFSATAKGDGVDEICGFLNAKGAENYLVEIGGETRAKGEFMSSGSWQVGINIPDKSSSTKDLFAAVILKDRALATSGNYRNYREVEGKIIAHTISPKTGFPEESNLLSASILAPTCADADGLATACMVMGLERSKQFVESMECVEGYFIFANALNEMEAWGTPGFLENIQE